MGFCLILYCRANFGLSLWLCGVGLIGFYFAVTSSMEAAIRDFYENRFSFMLLLIASSKTKVCSTICSNYEVPFFIKLDSHHVGKAIK